MVGGGGWRRAGVSGWVGGGNLVEVGGAILSRLAEVGWVRFSQGEINGSEEGRECRHRGWRGLRRAGTGGWVGGRFCSKGERASGWRVRNSREIGGNKGKRRKEKFQMGLKIFSAKKKFVVFINRTGAIEPQY